ncbi:unnamed protein product (macronuclear) [Paramecium tetraurelia]|uniref:Uncharacterized protein n=1 Tax=Paramecium tetraurelia TaxID=5888 RepID=A0D1N2_PARTE|nr:uncharacterized protein GSPATT00012473001 [Paramecium tetraurelia]CAK76949.1 unnamed protein product [Paramecium tetraurelia]|eukprot:XP_001444346.1 hypothetical protein (macronuclear) [Paramecium tetraurelia strain d4-2]
MPKMEGNIQKKFTSQNMDFYNQKNETKIKRDIFAIRELNANQIEKVFLKEILMTECLRYQKQS